MYNWKWGSTETCLWWYGKKSAVQFVKRVPLAVRFTIASLYRAQHNAGSCCLLKCLRLVLLCISQAKLTESGQKSLCAANTQPSIHLQFNCSASKQTKQKTQTQQHLKAKDLYRFPQVAILQLIQMHSLYFPNKLGSWGTANLCKWIFFNCFHKTLKIVITHTLLDFRDLSQGRRPVKTKAQIHYRVGRFLMRKSVSRETQKQPSTASPAQSSFNTEISWGLCNILECLWKILGM